MCYILVTMLLLPYYTIAQKNHLLFLEFVLAINLKLRAGFKKKLYFCMNR